MYNYFSGDDFDGDCKTLLEYVKKMKLHTANNRKTINKGKAPYSCVYGTVPWKSYSNGKERTPAPNKPGSYVSKLREDNPWFEEVIREFTFIYNPDFEYNQVVINRNFECEPHVDANNVGVSSIIGLGEYGGGCLNVQIDNENTKVVDIYHSFFTFNGSIYRHWVQPFTGTRYSIVFYNY
jgi:hypothetical protein